jgi:hypothetical protein
MGQHAAGIGVKLRSGSPSTLGEKVASGLVWRFSTIHCVSDNLDCFENGFGASGSFLDIGGHRFYIAKPFPKEVTDMSDPLSNSGSSCSESSDLSAMVEVLALEEGDGSGQLRTSCPPLECPPLPEQDAPPPEWDILDSTIMDLRAPLDLTADPAKIAENLEQVRIALLDKAVDINDTRRCVNSMLHEYNTTQGYTPAGDGPSQARQVRQRGRDLGMKLNQAAPSARSPPVIAKLTYSTPTKNLRAARYITSELGGLQGKELQEKKAWLQELLNTDDLQQQAMEPDGEASGMWRDHCLVAASQNKPQAQQDSSPNQG